MINNRECTDLFTILRMEVDINKGLPNDKIIKSPSKDFEVSFQNILEGYNSFQWEV